MSQKKRKIEEEIYDITTYTNDELFDILDLNSPSDRELEAKIIFLIRKYENIQNNDGNKLAHFFQSIYKHFFDIESDDEENIMEGMDGMNTIEPIPSFSGFSDDPNSIIENGNKIITAAPNSVIQQQENAFLNNKNNQSMNPLKKFIESEPNLVTFSTPSNILTSNLGYTIGTPSIDRNEQIGFTKTLNYSKSVLNPLLSQTVKRIISIDSQYRDNKQAMSTNFTFNLSETLKDVVSIKLYSVQIPYTWYTINNAFGGNFFFIKGNSPGINNGYHDYKINIPSGNYSPSDLITAINNSITTVSTIYTDCCFGTTNFFYNSATSLCQGTFDITKEFNESAYYLSFNETNWISQYSEKPMNDSSNNEQRKTNIPAFLGFDLPIYRFEKNEYYPFKIKSNIFLFNSSNYTSDRIYSIDSTNNYFTIYQYTLDTTNETTTQQYFNLDTSIIDFSFNIQLFNNRTYGLHTASEIVTELSDKINNSIYFNTSYSNINRFNTSSNSVYGEGSYYELVLKMNRFTVFTSPNTKTVIQFPNETSITPIWTTSNSCFKFNSNTIELNDILSDTNPLSQEKDLFNITTNPYIKLYCIKKGFDCSSNDFIIDVSNSQYNTNDYLDAINNGIINTNNTQSLSSNKTDIFIQNTNCQINENNIFELKFDINRIITQNYLIMNLNDTGLYQNGLYQYFTDTSYNFNILENNIIRSIDLPITPFFIDSTKPFVRFYPFQINKYLTNDLSYTIIPIIGGSFNPTDNELGIAIQNIFRNFEDPLDKSNPFSNTTCNIINNGKTFYISLTINYRKVLTQNDYSIQFFDVSNITQTNISLDLSGYITDIPYDNPIINPYSKNKINFFNKDLSFNLKNIGTTTNPIIFSFDLTSSIYTLDSSYIAFLSSGYSDYNYLISTPTTNFPISSSLTDSSLNSLGSNITNKFNYNNDFNGTSITFTRNSDDSTRVDCSIIIDISNSLYKTTNYILYLNGYNYNNIYTPVVTSQIKDLYSNYKIGFLSKYFGLNEHYDTLSDTIYSTGNSIPNGGYIIDTSFMAFFGLNNRDSTNTNSKNYLIPCPIGNYSGTNYSTLLLGLQNDINNIFKSQPDLSGTSIYFRYNSGTVDCSLIVQIKQTYNLFNNLSTWKTNLYISDSMILTSFKINDSIKKISTYTVIDASDSMKSNYINIDNTNNTIFLTPFEDGVNDPTGSNTIELTIPTNPLYTRDNLLIAINSSFSNYTDSYGNTILSNSRIFIKQNNGIDQTVIRIIINKIYTAYNYNLVLYDPYSFVKCYIGDKSVSNVTWDSTLGWILGFRYYTIYNLSKYGNYASVIIINGDTGVSTNLYNYFMICLDDYNQNRLTDGVVTITKTDTQVPLPSYVNRTLFYCDPVTNQLVYDTTTIIDNNRLTQNQIYAITQTANNISNQTSMNTGTEELNSNTYNKSPYVEDIFGIVPMKVNGLQNGQVYVEFGGSLQNQERSYFGPVNIRKMAVKLVSDRGDVLDLNGANWSFSLICEQIYQQNPNE